MIFDLAPGACLLALWAGYLSIVSIGRDFLSFQWDILLLETGFLAIFLAPWRLRPAYQKDKAPSTIFLWLLRWLLFRLMLESGLVKLASGDPTWRKLTALYYHYQTQPLPTWIGYYAHQLAAGFQRFSAGVMFFIELAVPFLVLMPRRPRRLAFFAFLFLQLLIGLTGNYGFFNLLAVALCVTLLDDGFLLKALPKRLAKALDFDAPAPRLSWRTFAAIPLILLIGYSSLLQFSRLLGGGTSLEAAAQPVLEAVEGFHLCSNYGLFAMMTTTRLEISIEGSDDGQTWKEYEFKWKPGDVTRRPAFVEPHMPRLDWQMWFAALTPYDQTSWYLNFLVQILQGSKPVLALLKTNPFPDHPPLYLRSLGYDYRFTTLEEKRATGAWWHRELKGLYAPTLARRK